MRFLTVSLAIVAAAVFPATVMAECAANGLAVVVNKANSTEGLSMAQLRRLVLGDLRNWPDKKPVSLVMPDPQSASFKCVLSAIVRMSDAEFHRYVANAEFRGEDPIELKTAGSAAAATKLVSGAAGAIAIVDSATATSMASSARVLRINGKQPGEAGYPL
jgi:ABC-type phosphate transport system substrate-binding protein